MKLEIPVPTLYLKLQKAIEDAPSIPPCQTTDPEIWYVDKGEVGGSYRLAKQLCSQCPVVQECAEYAIRTGEPDGCWGGLTPRERMQMRTKHLKINLKGRPRKSKNDY